MPRGSSRASKVLPGAAELPQVAVDGPPPLPALACLHCSASCWRLPHEQHAAPCMPHTRPAAALILLGSLPPLYSQRVVNSKGREPYSTCDKQVAAMKKCLQQHGLFPFSPSSSSVAGGGSFRARRPVAAPVTAAPAP